MARLLRAPDVTRFTLVRGQIHHYDGIDHPHLRLDLVQHLGEVELFVVNLHVGDVPPLVVAHPIGVN